MDQWLGWGDPRYNQVTQYWRTIFPTMEAFTKWATDYCRGKPWQVRWDASTKLIQQCTDAMAPYHDLSKDDQKLPQYVSQIKFIRAQCVFIHHLRIDLCIEQSRRKP